MTKYFDFDNKENYGVQVCTSTTRPTAYDGRPIYETDTNKFLIYNLGTTTWEEISGSGGVTDHSLLTNLVWSAAGHTIDTTLDMNSNKITELVDPTANQEAATKKYVDDNIGGVTAHSALTNLAWSVAGHTINADISPTSNQAYHLGSASNAFNTLFVDSLSNFTSDAQIECLKNFDMNAHDIYNIDGLYLNAGATMYLTDDSGDMKLHVATGKKVKIVVG